MEGKSNISFFSLFVFTTLLHIHLYIDTLNTLFYSAGGAAAAACSAALSAKYFADHCITSSAETPALITSLVYSFKIAGSSSGICNVVNARMGCRKQTAKKKKCNGVRPKDTQEHRKSISLETKVVEKTRGRIDHGVAGVVTGVIAVH